LNIYIHGVIIIIISGCTYINYKVISFVERVDIMNLKRKVIAIVLSVAVTLVMTPMMAFASDGTSATTVKTAEELTAAIENGGPIVLGADIETTTTAQVTKDIVFDMNGHALTVNKGTEEADKGDAFYVVGGTLTIKDSASNGSIRAARQGITVKADETPDHSSQVNSSVIVESGNITSQEMGIAVFGKGGNVTVNGGTIMSSDNAAVGGNGTKDTKTNDGGYTITVNNGTLIGNTQSSGWKNCGLYHPNAGDVVVNGGTIKGTTGAGIVVRGGNLTVNAGTVSGNGTANAGDKMGDATQTACGGIEVGYATGANLESEYPGGIGNIAIKGGNISSEKDYAIHVYGSAADSTNSKASTIDVTGGSFNGKLISGSTDNVNFSGILTAENDLCLDSLLNNINNGTVKLGTDITKNVSVPKNKKMTLDLNGHKLNGETAKDPGHKGLNDSNELTGTIVNRGDLTVADSSAGKTGMVSAGGKYSTALFNAIGAQATLDSGTFNDYDVTGGDWYIIVNLGDMAINKGTTVAFKDPAKNSDTAVINGVDHQVNGQYSSYTEAEKNTNHGQCDTPDKMKSVMIKDADMTINGGTFNGSHFVVKNGDWYAKMTIKDGTFTTNDSQNTQGACVSDANNSPLTISGGTFEAKETIPAVKIKNKTAYTGNGTDTGVVVKGGTFKQTGTGDVIKTIAKDSIDAPVLTIDNGSFAGNINETSATGEESYKVNDLKLVINAGTFTVDPENYVPSTSLVTKNSDTDYSVRVLDKAKDDTVVVSSKAMSIVAGESSALTATAKDPAAKFTWTSSDPAVAAVDANGKVTAVAAGKTTITVTTNNYGLGEVSDTCEITVQPKAGTTVNADNSKDTNVYKVDTSTSSGATVIVTKPETKTVKTVAIPATITINGVAVKVVAIGSSAYSKCSKLVKASVGSNVQTIGKNVFYKCTRLASVSIGKRVKAIGSKTFYGDKNLKKISIASKSIKKVGSKAFKGIYKKARINVPNSKIKAYKKIFKKAGMPKTVKVY